MTISPKVQITTLLYVESSSSQYYYIITGFKMVLLPLPKTHELSGAIFRLYRLYHNSGATAASGQIVQKSV
jgi:hypothetical protein